MNIQALLWSKSTFKKVFFSSGVSATVQDVDVFALKNDGKAARWNREMCDGSVFNDATSSIKPLKYEENSLNVYVF